MPDMTEVRRGQQWHGRSGTRLVVDVIDGCVLWKKWNGQYDDGYWGAIRECSLKRWWDWASRGVRIEEPKQ
jgi:hypothetical protein